MHELERSATLLQPGVESDSWIWKNAAAARAKQAQTRARRLLFYTILFSVGAIGTAVLFRVVYDRFPNYQPIAAFPEIETEV